jgi:hypothetical protein
MSIGGAYETHRKGGREAALPGWRRRWPRRA